jgi:hypothetical protein
MKTLLVLLLLVTAPCFGQVTISDQLPPPVTYPVEVHGMTDAQFFQWATEFNKKQEVDLEKRREKLPEPQHIFGTETITERNWNGYNGRVYGYGRFNSGDYYGNGNQRTATYTRRWLNSYYTGPGPLVIVNPYCKPRP